MSELTDKRYCPCLRFTWCKNKAMAHVNKCVGRDECNWYYYQFVHDKEADQ